MRMVFDRLEDTYTTSRYVVIRETAPKFSIAVETLRRWVAQAEMYAMKHPSVRTEAQEEIRKLQRRNAELAGPMRS